MTFSNLKHFILWGTLTLLCAATAPAQSFFPADYVAARARFRQDAAAMASRVPGTEIGMLRVPSAVDNDLTIDYVLIPAETTPARLLIVTSGLHGVEAYAGSAVQFMMLEEMLPKATRRGVSVLLVHSLNPYGYKYHRRVSESNIDLNRNFAATSELFATTNEGYGRLDSFLNPQHPVSVYGPVAWARELTGLARTLLSGAMNTVRDAILQGQYDHPKGVYFGGNAFAANTTLVQDLLARMTEPYGMVSLLELHTGYGKAGVQHFWGNAQLTAEQKVAQDYVYKGFPVEKADGGEFYPVNGDFAAYFGVAFASKLGLAMTFEYGTIGSDTMVGSLDSLYRTKLENQGFQYGFANETSKRVVAERFLALYTPPSPAWRARVEEQARASLPLMLQRLEDVEYKGIARKIAKAGGGSK